MSNGKMSTVKMCHGREERRRAPFMPAAIMLGMIVLSARIGVHLGRWCSHLRR